MNAKANANHNAANNNNNKKDAATDLKNQEVSQEDFAAPF